MSLAARFGRRLLPVYTYTSRSSCFLRRAVPFGARRRCRPPQAIPLRGFSQSAILCCKSNGKRKKPKAVILDVGGVVAPSPLPIFEQFERKYGLSPGSLVDTIKCTGDEGAFARMERGEVTTEEFCEPFAREYLAHMGKEVTAEQIAEFMRDLAGGFHMNPEAAVAIKMLKKNGIKTAILTNNFRRNDGSTVLPQEDLNVDLVSRLVHHVTIT